MNNNIYAIHVLGTMTANQTFIIRGADSPWHAISKAMLIFSEPNMKNYLVKYKKKFYRAVNGNLRPVNLLDEVNKKQMVDQVLGKM